MGNDCEEGENEGELKRWKMNLKVCKLAETNMTYGIMATGLYSQEGYSGGEEGGGYCGKYRRTEMSVEEKGLAAAVLALPVFTTHAHEHKTERL